MPAVLLVAGDQETERQSLVEQLQGEGYQVHSAAGGKAGIAALDEHDIDLVLADLALPEAEVAALLRHIRNVPHQAPVILMTTHAAVPDAVKTIRLGAQDYLLKPVIFEDLLRKARQLLDHRKLARENPLLRREIQNYRSPEQPLGRSPAMQEVARTIRKVAPAPTPVLITGERGVGKEVVARAIHARSRCRENVFLAVNCSAIPENLLERELFGHIEGSANGAVHAREGLFQSARHGTIFLDGIGEMPGGLQTKLLRVLEEKAVLPACATTPVKVNVRILAATQRDLRSEVDAGRFREDLFFRLNVVEIAIPPLRQRLEDLPGLVVHLIERRNREINTAYKGVDSATMRILMSFPWKGNIRELDAVLERAMILGDGEWIRPVDLPGQAANGAQPDAEDNLGAALELFEKSHIERALGKAAGDKVRAAELLGLSLSTLYRKLEKLCIQA